MRFFPRRFRRQITIMLIASMVLGTIAPIGGSPKQAAAADSVQPTNDTWVTNGAVNDVVTDGTTTYLGGTFTQVAPYHGNGVPFNPGTGLPFADFSKVDATNAGLTTGGLYISIPDGLGGWYIGGQFRRVGGLARDRLAHILPSGHVDPAWNPGANGTVLGLAYDNGLVYAVGDFTVAGGASRTRIASINASGVATSWAPTLGTIGRTIKVDGDYVYVGGDFVLANATTRNRLAKIHKTTGVLDAWNPNASATAGVTVHDIEIVGSLAYIVGNFTTISAVSRTRVAAVDKSTAVLDPFAPTTNALTKEIDIHGGFAYLCGDFTNINGNATFNELGRTFLTGAGALDTTWDPLINAFCEDVEVVGTDIYVGGNFTSLGGSTRNRLGAVSIASAALNAWAPNANQAILSISLSGSNVYFGGWQHSISFETRNRVAAFSVSTGAALAFHPNVNTSAVQTLELSGSNLYIGGTFTTIGGTTRNNIGRVNATTAALDATWNPNANSTVFDILIDGSNIFLAGAFTLMGGTARNRLAKVNDSTGALNTFFNPNANLVVNSIDRDGSRIYAGGTFTTMGLVARNRLAAIDTVTGALDTLWNPNANLTVEVVKYDTTKVYVAGSFGIVGGATRDSIAELNTTTGAATTWNAGGTATTVNELVVTPTFIFLGGDFTIMGGPARVDIAQLNRTTALATTWNPANAATGAGVEAIALTPNGNHVYVGGIFTTLNGGANADEGRDFFAEYAFDAPAEVEIITIDGEVPETITFILSDATIGFGQLSTVLSRYATGDALGSGTEVVAHTLQATSNASSGYVMTVFGESLDNGIDILTAIGGITAVAPNPGTQQFGIRITAVSGSGTVSAPYGTANYAYGGVTTPDQIATASGPSLTTTYSLYYLANIDVNISSGDYVAQLTYTIAPTF